MNLTAEQVERAYRDMQGKKKVAAALHRKALRVEDD